MSLGNRCSALAARIQKRLNAASRNFAKSTRGNVAMIFALSLVPVSVAAGAGLDLSRALIVRARLAEALDAAGLAVGATSNLSTDQMTALARQYFKANYTADATFGIPADVSVTPGTDNVALSTSVHMPTTLMNIVGIDTLTVGYTSKIVWGQTKLWVSLVLDNTGSMCEPDNCYGTNNKITALKSATHSLLTTLQNAAANAGDVRVALIPFSKDVNVGTGNVSATWIDWTDWEAAPSNGTPSTSIGPGSSCPYSSSSKGYRCTVSPTNGASTTSTIPSSGTYKGYICPGMDNGNVSGGRTGHYYNGCFDSVATQTLTNTVNQTTTVVTTYSCTSNSSGTCTGSTTNSSTTNTSTDSTTNVTTSGYTGDSGPTTTNGTPTTTNGSRQTTSKKKNGVTTYTTTWTVTVATPSATVTKTAAAPYNHTWHANAHSTWAGCIMDRTQNYDTDNTTPTSSSTRFPAENSDYCPPGTITALTYDWTTLSNQVDAMTANGNTNQTIGLQWGWQALTDGDPMNAGTLPSDTQQIIILLSDGLNTQNRYSTSQSSIDTRMALACSNAKTNGHVIIYTVFVDLNGSSGSSTVLDNCATDHTKYFDLTTSGSIITTFNNIAQQITQLRVAQ